MIKFNLIKTHLFTIVTISTLLSCSKEFEINTIRENIEKQLPICLNEYKLLQAPDSIPYVPLKFSDNKSEVEQKFKQVFGEDICSKVYWYKIPIVFNKNINLDLKSNFYYNCGGCEDLFIIRPTIEILANENGQTLFEGKPLKITNISTSIFQYQKEKFIDKPTVGRNDKITIQLDIKTPVDTTKKIIDQVLNGYLLSANYYTEVNLNKKICALDNKELLDLKQIFPLKVQIVNFELKKQTRIIIPPPPPTVEIKIK